MWDKPMRKKAKRGRFPRKMLSRSRAPYSRGLLLPDDYHYIVQVSGHVVIRLRHGFQQGGDLLLRQALYQQVGLFPGFQCGQHLFGKGGAVPHHGVMGRIIPQGVVLGGGIGAFLPLVGLFQLVRRDKQIGL